MVGHMTGMLLHRINKLRKLTNCKLESYEQENNQLNSVKIKPLNARLNEMAQHNSIRNSNTVKTNCGCI